MSDYENDDYDDYDDEYNSQFAAEFAAHERTSRGIIGDTGEYSFDPKDKFTRKVSSQVSYLIDTKYISPSEKEPILQAISSLQNISMRNPTAFIFGYIASNGGSNINTQSWKRAFKIFKEVSDVDRGDNPLWDKNVSQVDIIRYGRYWVYSNL